MYKKPVVLNKTLVIGVILLFVGIAIAPGITAFDNDTDDVDDESSGNSEIGTSDEYEEIITYIFGYGKINWIKRRGIFRGDVEINQENFINLSLRGLRLSNSGVEKYNITEVGYVHAPRFIGFSIMNILDTYGTIGLAFGNIEWELLEW